MNDKKTINNVSTLNKIKKLCNFTSCAVLLFNLFLLPGIYWALGSAILCITIGHYAKYHLKKNNLPSLISSTLLCLIVGYLILFIYIFFFAAAHYSQKEYEKERNLESIQKIPDAQKALSSPPFNNFDGISIGMKPKEAINTIASTHSKVEDGESFFIYKGSEMGENTSVTVWNWDRGRVTNIDVNYYTEDIKSFIDCDQRFQETLEILVEKYAQPQYFIKPKSNKEDGFNRYYFCFGNDAYMFHNMIYFNSAGCSITTSIEEGLCSRAILDFLEYGDNKKEYTLEVLKD